MAYYLELKLFKKLAVQEEILACLSPYGQEVNLACHRHPACS